MALYGCIDESDEDKKLELMEATFAKAWMLHCYIDDVVEEEVEELPETSDV